MSWYNEMWLQYVQMTWIQYVQMAGWAKENIPGGSLKYLSVYQIKQSVSSICM